MGKEGVINLEGCDNCRDIGGNITKWGGEVKRKKLVRAAQLNRLTQSDVAYLEEYGIKKIIDLRGERERASEPDKKVGVAENIHIPIFKDMRIPVLNDNFLKAVFPKLKLLEEVLFQQKKRMVQVYKNFVVEENAINAYKRIFRILIDNGKEGESVLFHCTAGKDRTGFVSALIMAALDVDKDEIMQDYLLTNNYLSGKVQNTISKLEKIGISDKIIEKAKGYFAAREEYLETAFDMIETCFGSVEGYLYGQLELTESKRIVIYDNYSKFIT